LTSESDRVIIFFGVTEDTITINQSLLLYSTLEDVKIGKLIPPKKIIIMTKKC